MTLRYVVGTTNYGVLYLVDSDSKLIEYTESDFAGSVDDKKITSGYVFRFGSGVVAWDSKKQPIVTLSYAEEEYVVATTIACHTVWMRRIVTELLHE
jgi:hypothetical protein